MSLGRSGLLQLSSDIHTLYLSFIFPSLFIGLHPLELAPSMHSLSLNAVHVQSDDDDLYNFIIQLVIGLTGIFQFLYP